MKQKVSYLKTWVRLIILNNTNEKKEKTQINKIWDEYGDIPTNTNIFRESLRILWKLTF
jgi:hypothetical protein